MKRLYNAMLSSVALFYSVLVVAANICFLIIAFMLSKKSILLQSRVFMIYPSSLDAFSQGEYIRIHLDGDYIDSDDDAFRVIARQLTAPMLRRRKWSGE